MKSEATFDIMLNGRFYGQLAYRFCPLFNFPLSEFRKYVEKKYPTLKGKPYNFIPTKQKVR